MSTEPPAPMQSTFVDHQTRSILQTARSWSKDVDGANITPRGQRLESLVAQLDNPLQKDALFSMIQTSLKELDENECASDQEEALEWATLTRSVVGVYTHVMSVLLAQARQADEEADFWRRVEQVGGGTAWYLLQTLPLRLARFGNGMLSTLRTHNQTISINTFSVQNLDRIFPPHLLSHLFKRCFFPHLNHPYDVFRTNPIELTRQECRQRRIELERIRDRRAKSLGTLSNLRRTVEQSLSARDSADSKKEAIATILELLETSLDSDPLFPPVLHAELPSIMAQPKVQIDSLSLAATTRVVLPRLQIILSATLPTYAMLHESSLAPLKRPSRLTRLWPRFVFFPPLAFIAFRTLFNSRAQLYATMIEAQETIAGFWNGWVIEPIRGILQTVRTGGDDTARVVSPEGLHSDMDSLERMVTSLAKEKLNFTDAQLTQLSSQVRQGDLTSVLKLYEQDIKNPLTSVFTGNLIRSLLIQIHKTKVDVDLALTGIDKLIRSQELTFAFVGIAPSMAILYVAGGWARRMWVGSRGRGRLGGLRNRESVWIAMRRIERLLTNPSDAGPAMTQGLLLLSINHLRAYAVSHLPPRSQIQLGFLEDIDDLEDAKGDLSREDRLRIVGRMWRSWGVLLGWNGDAVDAGGSN